MHKSKIRNIPILLLLTIFILSCNFAAATQTAEPVPTVPVTIIVEPTSVPQSSLPRDEAAVPRVPVEHAKGALDSGDAIIVDVRGADAYARGHIAGSLEVSLSAIQSDPANLPLDKNRWIITYCT